MCQTGLRVNSSSISMLGDPAKGKISIQRTKRPVCCSGDINSFKNKSKSPDKLLVLPCYLPQRSMETPVFLNMRNCICLDQARSSVFLLPPQTDEDGVFPRECCRLFTSPFQFFFFPLLITTFVTKVAFWHLCPPVCSSESIC